MPLVPRACTASFWIGRQLEHGEPLIQPWLYAGQSYMIWGKRGSGKSQTLLSTVFAGATGTPFGKWAPTKKVRTAFFDFEMSQFDLQMRIGEMVEHFGDPGENMIAISTIDFPQIHPLDTHAKAKYLLAILDDFKPDIIAIDNIQACVSQSIKSGDAFTALKPVKAAIRERQICAIWGHHAGFSDDHHYGDSQLDFGDAGTMKVEKQPSPVDELKASITVDKPFRVIRGNAAEDIPQTVVFRSGAIDLVESGKGSWQDSMNECGKAAERVEDALRNNQQKALAALTKALSSNGYTDTDKHRVVAVTVWREWCDMDGLKEAAFRKAKQRLLERKIIIESGRTVRQNRE